ncbi:MAG: tripartite tricarboxylate transporter TctB family protein [Clostridiaceae bacterium]|nr:tripartite tricarboxylate transporter TctB family protein [Clostridiaceae bacterium]
MFKNKTFEDLKEFIAGLGLIVFAGFYLLYSFQIKSTLNNGMGGSKFFPWVIGSLILGLGLIQTVKSLIILARTKEKSVKKAGINVKNVVLTFVYFGAYACLMQTIGFLIGTFFYLIGMIHLLSPKGTRSFPKIILIAAVADLVIYLMFTRCFGVILPMGPIIF